MIEKDGSTFVASCDFCANYVDTEETIFQDAVDKIKALGWKVFKKMKEWHHKCGCCQADEGPADYQDES